MVLLRFAEQKSSRPVRPGIRRILAESSFRQMLSLEHTRSQRTGQFPALLTVETTSPRQAGTNSDLWPAILSVLQGTTRECDLTGWVETNVSIGVLLTEVIPDRGLTALRGRISSALRQKLTPEEFECIRLVTSTQPEELRMEADAVEGLCLARKQRG